VDFMTRPRLSALRYTGFKKLTRLPKRSAAVAFSVDDVYAIAELVRRQRGGTAIVLGALSPRTRNRQVEMYQSGEVDFLVATDAIGMGLNMDIHHIALASIRKFDGQSPRPLGNAEIAQVAGRAGRHMRDGTFGVTGRLTMLDEDTVEAVENHAFDPLRALYWRNNVLDFRSPHGLLASLDKSSGNQLLIKGCPADDYLTLSALMKRDDVMARAEGKAAVGLLWDVCQIPDFRRTLSDRHQEMIADIYVTLMDRGVLDPDHIRRQVEMLDRTEGDVDALMARIAHIRTWTYIAHKPEWLRDASSWQEETRAVEDRLSDALHDALTKRFVDRRAAVLIRAGEEGSELLAGVRADGTVVVEGHEVGRLEGFRFAPDDGAAGADYKAVMKAARQALKPEIRRRLAFMLKADNKQFKLDDEGRILYQTIPNNPLPGSPVAHIRKGGNIFQPDIDVLDSPLLEGQDKAAAAEKLREWLKQHIDTVLEPLIPLVQEDGLEGTARGIAYQLLEALGILPRADLESLIAGLDESGRAALRARKVRLGPVLVFLPALNKPAAIRLRALLWSLWNGQNLPAALPPDGVTSFSVADKQVDPAFYRAIGYPVYGPRAIRVDMLDRVISAIYDGAKDGVFRADHKMAEWMGCSLPDLYAVLEAMGHRKIEEPAAVAETSVPETAPAPEEKPAMEQPAETASEAKSGGEAAAEQLPLFADAPAEQPATEAKQAAPPKEKPPLALFRLRKGRAYDRPRAERPDRPDRPPRPERPERKDREKSQDRDQKARDRNRSRDKDKDRDRRDRDDRPRRKDSRPPREERERVISAPSKATPDSPFAILQGLKVKDGK
jgi:ATP-dependent RNA helicase SUPV3L1/SUV3